jgi:hypothetical protein
MAFGIPMMIDALVLENLFDNGNSIPQGCRAACAPRCAKPCCCGCRAAKSASRQSSFEGVAVHESGFCLCFSTHFLSV